MNGEQFLRHFSIRKTKQHLTQKGSNFQKGKQKQKQGSHNREKRKCRQKGRAGQNRRKDGWLAKGEKHW